MRTITCASNIALYLLNISFAILCHISASNLGTVTPRSEPCCGFQNTYITQRLF